MAHTAMNQFYFDRDASYLLRLFSDTLTFKLHSAGLCWVPAPWREQVSFRPTTYVGQIEHADDTVRILGGRQIVLKAGQAVILPPNQRLFHELAPNASGKSRICWSHFQILMIHSMDLASHLELPLVLKGRMADRFGDFNKAFVEAGRHMEANPLAAAARIRRVAYEMLETILDIVPMKAGTLERFKSFSRFEAVLEHIRDSLGRHLTIGALSKKAAMSPPRFHAAFKEAIGVSPMEYVISIRIESAQNLLGFSRHSIGEVASMCGYEDQQYFSKVFKARTGSTPGQYRADIRAGIGIEREFQDRGIVLRPDNSG